MTNFVYLSEDKLVQSASYGKDIKVIVNFSNEEIEIDKAKLKAKSAFIYNHGKKQCIHRSRKNNVKCIVALLIFHMKIEGFETDKFINL